MVFRVCRGVLRDEHAAEDAFQATFLVLARKARSLWVKDSLASWLHGVAHRVAPGRGPTRPAAAGTSDGSRRPAARRAKSCRIIAVWSEAERSSPRRSPGSPRSTGALGPLLPGGDVVPGGGGSLGVTEDTVRGRLARARERLRQESEPAEGSRSPPSSLRPRAGIPAVRAGPDWCRPRPAGDELSRRAGRWALAAISDRRFPCAKGRAGP